VVLPERPLKLHGGYIRRQRILASGLLVFGPASLIAGAYLGPRDFLEIRRQQRTWREGEMAREAQAEGSERTKWFVWHDYKLKVRFVDAAGKTHAADTSFGTLFMAANTHVEPSVRYRPDDPSDFALSWAVDADAMPWRWASLAVGTLAALGLGLGFSVAALPAWRRLQTLQLCAREGIEIELRIAESDGDRYVFTGRGPGGESIRVKFETDRDGGPLFRHADPYQAVALVAAREPARPIVVCDTLLPFEFTADEEAAIRRRL
jgi:hypothetical protein